MSALQTSVARAAASTRWKGENHPDTISLRAQLAADQIEVAIQKTLQSAPPLTDTQVDRLAALLRGGAK